MKTRLIIANQIGKRNPYNTLALLRQVKERINLDNNLYFSSDGYEGYTSAIRCIFGIGRTPKKLCYAQVVKEKKNGRLKNIVTKIIFGSFRMLNKHISQSLQSYTINTSFIERCNLTMRQRNHRVERKSLGFSKCIEYHKAQMRISIAYYNFCLLHSSLKKYKGAKPIFFTPAMEIGITKHPWTMLELLKYQFYD